MAVRASARATGTRLIAAFVVLAPHVACSTIPAAEEPPSDGGGAANSAIGAPLDAAGSDALIDASACYPGEVQTFTPAAYHAAAKPSNACSIEVPQRGGGTLWLWEVFYRDCFDPSSRSEASCDSDNANPTYAACGACVLTWDTANLYGPLLTDSTGWVRTNVAGCIELSDHGSAGLACARSVQELQSCELAACEANCPVIGYDTSSTAPYDECAIQADGLGCEPFVAAASCALPNGADALDASDDAGVFGCRQATTFQQFYNLAVPLFCAAPTAAADAAAPDAAETASDSGSSSTGSGSSSGASGSGSSGANYGLDAGTD